MNCQLSAVSYQPETPQKCYFQRLKADSCGRVTTIPALRDMVRAGVEPPLSPVLPCHHYADNPKGLKRNQYCVPGIQSDCNLCQMVGYYMTGRMSYVHDIAADPFNNVTFHMHCGCPIRNVWGDKDLPYMIRDYTTGRWHEELKRRDGAVPVPEFPIGVPVTIWKIQVVQKRILIWTGTSISGHSLYKDFEDVLFGQRHFREDC